MSTTYHIVVEPDVAKGWICYNTAYRADVQAAIANGGWEMARSEAIRIFGEENFPIVCPVNTQVSPDGRTVTFTPPTKAERDADAARDVRARRDRLLAETDYLAMPDYPLSGGRRAAVFAYRQALRDVTKQPGFPRSVAWPKQPE